MELQNSDWDSFFAFLESLPPGSIPDDFLSPDERSCSLDSHQ